MTAYLYCQAPDLREIAVRCQLKLGNAFLCSSYRSGPACSNYRLVTEPKNLEWHIIASKNNHETQRKKINATVKSKPIPKSNNKIVIAF